MLRGAIYEQDFRGCSYGVREGRSPHQALHGLRERCMDEHIGWSVGAEVRAFFDSLDHDLVAVLPKRFARFHLTIHPQKTRLVRFQPPRGPDEGERGDGTFEFLGLTHDWAQSRRGYWGIKRRTAKKRLWRAMRAVWHWCRAHRHDPIRAQYRQLCPKLRGHYQYYGIRGNYRKRQALYRSVERAWRYWLSRRGGPRTIRWERFALLRAEHPLPTPRIMHNI
jgi:hypothetical protein